MVLRAEGVAKEVQRSEAYRCEILKKIKIIIIKVLCPFGEEVIKLLLVTKFADQFLFPDQGLETKLVCVYIGAPS